MSLIIHAQEKEKEQLTWELWSSLYPLMEAGWVKFKGYNELYKELFRPQIRTTIKDINDITTEMERIVTAYEGR